MEEKGNNHVFIDINKLANTMSTELENLPSSSVRCCIYRASKLLRELDEKAYTPRSVSIGPYHYGRNELQPMEEHKKRYLKYFLHRIRMRNISVVDLIRVVAKNETRLRNCYAEVINMLNEEFIKMILVDAAFILELFIRENDREDNDSSERLLNEVEDILAENEGLSASVCVDLCLVENQIPFFILDELFELYVTCCTDRRQELSLESIALSYFGCFIYSKRPKKVHSLQVDHLSDLVRICNHPNEPNLESNRPRILEKFSMPPATELYRAGVKFKARPDQSLFDIKFSNGVMEIPELIIDPDTETFFRNMLELEHRYGITIKYYNDYIAFMNLLANSPKDVELLIKNGVIENYSYDSEKISGILGRLAEAFIIYPGRFYYTNLVQDLNEYSTIRFHKWKATLARDYFNNPWSIISVIAAGILLILTVIQTVCSIKQV